jgi:hypothetical protein
LFFIFRPCPPDSLRTEGYYTVYGDANARLYGQRVEEGHYETRYPLVCNGMGKNKTFRYSLNIIWVRGLNTG